jgi:heme-degrading monooxygenase HmoA
MIKRIVKLTFKADKVSNFLSIFYESEPLIKNVEGCLHVELLNDINHKSIYFTYSYWQSEQALNNYRDSELFKDIWSRTKILFDDKPEAWSVTTIA